MLVIVLEHARGSVGDIVDTGAAQASCLQHVGGFVQLTATVFEGCVSQIVLLGGRIKDFGTVSFDDRNEFAEIMA